MVGRRRGSILFALLALGVSLPAAPTPARAGAEEALPLVEELVAAIGGAGLSAKTEQALTRPLERLARSLERGQETVALVHLQIFEVHVRLQVRAGLDPELAEGALESAHVIRVAIAPGPPPVLENLAVDFGDFDFAAGAGEDKLFLEFGAVVDSPEGPKPLPTFEYRLDPDAAVVSPLDGQVVAVEFKSDTHDWEIRLAGAPTSPFLVAIDHVTELAVAEGDAVVAGQPLGKPGSWSAVLGRTELQVFDFVARESHCPLAFADPALAPALQADVAGLMDAWESFKADASLYGEAGMVTPGCVEATLPEEP